MPLKVLIPKLGTILLKYSRDSVIQKQGGGHLYLNNSRTKKKPNQTKKLHNIITGNLIMHKKISLDTLIPLQSSLSANHVYFLHMRTKNKSRSNCSSAPDTSRQLSNHNTNGANSIIIQFKDKNLLRKISVLGSLCLKVN